MKKRWLILILIGLVFVWWLPNLVESGLRLRTLPNGLAWEVSFNGPANEEDNPAHVAVAGDGHVLLTGVSFGKGGGGWLVKHDGNTGRELWRRIADFALVSKPAAEANGGIYLAGSQTLGYRPGLPSGRVDTDFLVSKVSRKTGMVEWNSAFDGGLRDTDWAEELVLASDGNPVAAGFTPDDTRYFGCVEKLNARDGSVLWQHRTQDASVELWHGSLALIATPTGDVVFASSRKSHELGSSRISFWLTKLHGKDGHPVWTTEFPPAPLQSHMLTHVATTSDGDVIAAGYHATNRGRSLLVARFAGHDGRLLWRSEHDAESHETIEPTSLIVGAEGDAFIGARSWNGSLTTPGYDRWILKLSANDGHRVWVHRDAGKPAPSAAGAICSTPKLLMNSAEMLVCVGSIWNGSNVDVQAQWLSSSDGSVVRTLSFDGAAHDHDLFRDAALTQSGEVVVALASSRCPGWIKPFKALRYRPMGGMDWISVNRETNQVNDADPYNYDTVLWKSL